MEKRETVRKKWVEIVARLRESGASQPVFAAATGVGLAALRYWITKLRREERQKQPHAASQRSLPDVRLIPVTVARARQRPRHAITIRVAAVRVVVGDQADAALVARSALALKRQSAAC